MKKLVKIIVTIITLSFLFYSCEGLSIPGGETEQTGDTDDSGDSEDSGEEAVPTELSLSNLTVRNDGLFTVTFIAALDRGISDSTEVSLFLSTDGSFSSDDTPLFYERTFVTSVEGIKVYNTSNFSSSLSTTLPDGQYYVIVRVTDESLEEDDPSDNILISPTAFDLTHDIVTGSYTPPVFDLIPSAPVINTDTDGAFHSLDLEVTATDYGNPGDVKISLVFSDDDQLSDDDFNHTLFATAYVSLNSPYDNNLDRDELMAIVKDRLDPAGADYTAYVFLVVDEDDTIDESNEGNNSAVTVGKIVLEQSLDLRITTSVPQAYWNGLSTGHPFKLIIVPAEDVNMEIPKTSSTVLSLAPDDFNATIDSWGTHAWEGEIALSDLTDRASDGLYRLFFFLDVDDDLDLTDQSGFNVPVGTYKTGETHNFSFAETVTALLGTGHSLKAGADRTTLDWCPTYYLEDLILDYAAPPMSLKGDAIFSDITGMVKIATPSQDIATPTILEKDIQSMAVMNSGETHYYRFTGLTPGGQYRMLLDDGSTSFRSSLFSLPVEGKYYHSADAADAKTDETRDFGIPDAYGTNTTNPSSQIIGPSGELVVSVKANSDYDTAFGTYSLSLKEEDEENDIKSNYYSNFEDIINGREDIQYINYSVSGSLVDYSGNPGTDFDYATISREGIKQITSDEPIVTTFDDYRFIRVWLEDRNYPDSTLTGDVVMQVVYSTDPDTNISSIDGDGDFSPLTGIAAGSRVVWSDEPSSLLDLATAEPIVFEIPDDAEFIRLMITTKDGLEANEGTYRVLFDPFVLD